jgi:hypothetical protein
MTFSPLYQIRIIRNNHFATDDGKFCTLEAALAATREINPALQWAIIEHREVVSSEPKP